MTAQPARRLVRPAATRTVVAAAVAVAAAVLSTTLLVAPARAQDATLPAAAPAPAQDAGVSGPVPTPALVEPPREHIMAPPLPRGMTRVAVSMQPFLSIIGPGVGAVADARIEHYFKHPWKLGLELSPLALAIEPDATGAIGHLRLHAAYATDQVEVGFGAGARLQHYGPNGLSMAATIRLGSLDGLHVVLENAYSIFRNYYTDRVVYGFSNVLGEIDVPLSATSTLTLDGGGALDLWAYAAAGLKHYVHGTGGPGTLIVKGTVGFAWVLDRFPCQYTDPRPCSGAGWALGPTIGLGFEQRF